MTSRLVRSTPLRPLAQRMRELTRGSTEFWAATAFLSKDAMLDVLDAAADSSATVRILTGTFGNSTRVRTFRSLLRRTERDGNVRASVWHCGTHGAFHAKLYLWKMTGGHAVAWIGSANLTDGGMQNEGELVLEVGSGWNAPTIRNLRMGFELEWKRATPLSREFLTSYRESKRAAPDHRVAKHLRPPPMGPGSPLKRAGPQYFTASVDHWVTERSQLYERAERLVGAANYWMHQPGKRLRLARKGDRCVLVDLVDRTAALVEITDTFPDDNARILNDLQWT